MHSALTIPGAKRYILPAMDNVDEVSTPLTPWPGIVNADQGFSAYRNDEIMLALRASGGGHLSHHADNGSLLLAVKGNLVFINAGRSEQNADGNSALMLVCAKLRHVASTQWGCKKYMNMKHLETILEDISIAG